MPQLTENVTDELKQLKKPQAVTIDDLLQTKRQQLQKVRPSDGFWENTFAPKFARQMMAALSRPRRISKAWTVAGWVVPVALTLVFAVSLGVAYFFSPTRAIARWEAQAADKEYVVDTMQKQTSASYAIQSGTEVLVSQTASELTVPETLSQF